MNRRRHSYYFSVALLLGVMCVSTPAQAAPLQFTTNPYVTNITTNSAVVNWTTDVPADSTVWYTATPPSWQQQDSSINGLGHFYGLGAVTGTRNIWAVGYPGKIVHTTDGINWSEQNSGSSAFLNDVDAVAANNAWAVGDTGTILHYNGTTWTPQTSGTTTPLLSVKAFDANNVFAVGYNGLILRYNGSSWSQMNTGTTTVIFSDIDGDSPTSMFAVGSGGAIYRYTGGAWQAQASPVSTKLTGIEMVNATSGWAVGEYGVALKYSSGGWSNVTVGTGSDLYDVAATDMQHVWLVGPAGIIVSTIDGTTWSTAYVGTKQHSRVYALDSTNVWTAGLDATIYHYGYNFTNSIYSSAPSSSSTLVPLASGTTYYYLVEASDGSNTITSAVGTFKTLTPDTTPPPSPTLSGTTDCTTGGTFFNNLSWTAVTDPAPDASGVSGYTLTGNGTPLITNQLVTNFSHSSLTAGTSYVYSVRALDNAGNTSPASNTVSLTTKTKDFTLANNSGAQSVRAGDSAAYNLNLASECGFSENVSLSVTGLPSGASASFGPNNFVPAPGGTPDTMTVSTTRSVTPGTYPLTITATSATKSHTASATLTITPPTDYTLSISPATRTITAGNSTTYAVTATPLNGYTGTIDLTTTGLPSGAGGSYAPAASLTINGGAASATLTITTTTATPSGTHTFTVTGDDNATVGVKTTTADLVVNPAPDFTLTATPSPQTVAAGDPALYTISLTPLNSISGTAQLSASVPTGPTNTAYSPNLLTTSTPLAVTSGVTATMNFTITPAQNASAGTYVYTITATLQGVTKTVNITLTIGQPKDFTITVNPTTLTVSQGGSGTATVTVATANGLDANVSLAVTGLPGSATANWSANPVNPAGASVPSTLTINANAASQGTYTVTITGTYGSLSHSTTLTLQIVDTTPPVITFTSVTPNVLYATATWTTNEQATGGIYYWEGTDTTTTRYVEDTVLRTNHTLSFTGLNASTLYTFQIIGYDAAGNLGQDIERTVTTLAAPDTVPPIVIITQPATKTPAAILSGTTTVTGTATDNVGVVSVSLGYHDAAGVDSGNFSGRLTTDPATGQWSFNWDTLAVTNGAYQLYARASDAAGNIVISAEVPIEIFNDTSAPVITNISTSTTNTSAIIEWDTTGDSSTSVIDYGLENTDGTYSYTNRVSTDDSGQQFVEHHMVTLTNLTAFKRYHFQITSCDPTGNCGH